MALRDILISSHRFFLRYVLVTVILIAWASVTRANPNPGITYHGRIIKPNGQPLEGATVQFRLQIRTPGSENCLLFEELQTKNMSGSNGIFSLTINDGTGTRGPDGGQTLERIFQNRSSFTGLPECQSGSIYDPHQADGRRFVVFFRDETMANWEPLPAALINFVPLAIEARSVGGFNSSHLLRVTDDGTANGDPQNAPILNPSEASELKALTGGTSTRYMRSSSSGGATLPSYQTLTPPTSPVAGSVWYDSDAKVIKFFDGTNPVTLGTGGGGGGSGTVTSVTAGDGLAGGSFTVSGTISLPDVGTAGTYYKVTTDTKGRVTSGAATLAETDLPTISTPGKVAGGAITSGEIAGTTSIDTSGTIRTTGTLSTRFFDLYDSDSSHKIRFQTPATGDLTNDYTLTWPETAGSNGQVLTTNGAGVLSWQTVSGGGGSPTGAAGGDLDGTYPSPTLKEIVTAGTGTKISYDAKGRVTSSTTLDASDIPALDWAKVATGKPTTLSGYGITDAVQNAGGVVSIQAGDDVDRPTPGLAGRIYVAIDAQKIYRDNGTSWEVVASVDAAGGLGTVTEVTVSGAPLSVTNGTLVPEISIVQADTNTSGYLSAADWNTFNSKLSSLSSGDVTTALGFTPQSNALSENQVWIGNASDQAQASHFGIGQLRSTLTGDTQFPSSCATSQTLAWSSITDVLSCTNINNLNADKITAGTFDIARIPTGTSAATVAAGNDSRFPASVCGAGNKMRWDGASWRCETDDVTDSTKVAKIGDTMTGALNLPANGLAVGTDQLVANGSNVGIGTASPKSKLDVAGSVKIANDAVCDADKAGSIRFTGSAFEGCDGSSWISLSGGGGSGGGIVSCPTGWTMIGDAGKTATFCIETDERPAQDWHAAQSACNGINDATHGRAHLCTYNEWRTACERGAGLSNMTNNTEWLADLSQGDDALEIYGPGGCNALDSGAGVTYNRAFRCCLH